MNMDNWTDDILGSLDSIKRATPADGMLLKIQERIAENKIQNQKMPPKQWMAIAAGMLIVISLNAYVVANYYKTAAVETAIEIDTAYQIISDYNIYGS